MRMPLRSTAAQAQLTPKQRYHLLCGFAFGPLGEEVFVSKDHRRAAWESFRVDLLDYWTREPAEWRAQGNAPTFNTAEPGGPGTRPAGWWDFDAPEPRRDAGPDRRFEAEAAYLDRLGLLAPGEREALEPVDFEPWPAGPHIKTPRQFREHNLRPPSFPEAE